MKQFSNLPYHFGLKVRIYPSRSQKITIKKNSNANRFWYNWLLGLDQYKYDILNKYKLPLRPKLKHWYKSVYTKRKFTYAKTIFPFLKNKRLDSHAFNNARLNHNQAWNNYRNGSQNIPKYHSKRKQGNFWTYQTSCQYWKCTNGKHTGSARILDHKHVRLPKLGRIRTSRIRTLILKKTHLRIGRVTISKDKTDAFYVSFQLGSIKPFVYLSQRSNKLAMYGYDLNTSNFLMDTDHNNVPNPRFYEKAAQKYVWLDHCLKRKERHNKGRRLRDCKDYQKNRIREAKAHKHVREQRKNFLQQLSTKLIESHDFLVGENLRSKNMLKNHCLAKAIQSVGWRSFITDLSYKAKLYHKIFVLINPAYTTQMCSNCGYVCNKKDGTHLTLKDREWTCPKCGVHHIRDLNAAVNILHLGIKAILNYLPKTLRLSARMATNEHNLDQCGLQWLQYLTRNYYGAEDTTDRSAAKLIHENH